MRWIPKWKKGIPLVLYQHLHVHCALQIISQEPEFSFSHTTSWKCKETNRDENFDSTVYDPSGYCALTAFRNVYVQPAHCPIEVLHMKDLVFYDLLPCSLANIIFEYACSRLRYFKFVKIDFFSNENPLECAAICYLIFFPSRKKKLKNVDFANVTSRSFTTLLVVLF